MHHQFYMRVSNIDSKNLFPFNTCNNFFVQLPNTLNLIGSWEVGLSELQYQHSFSQTPINIDIGTTLCESSIIDGTRQSILRRVKVRGKQGDIIQEIFDRIQYFKVTRLDMDHIYLYIKGDGQDKSSLVDGTVHCTLHFRRYIPRLSLS